MAEDNTGLTYDYGSIKLKNNFDVSVTRPLDVRLVVKNIESLYDTKIMKSPYKGMLVNIEGTSDVYVYTASYKKDGVLQDGINGIQYPENWSKISSVEQINDNIFKERKYTNEEIKTFKEYMSLHFHNPQTGLVVHTQNTSKLYVLVDKSQYLEPKGWKRIGGIFEEFVTPIIALDGSNNNGELRKNASESPHNTFTGFQSLNPTFWVKIDKSKNKQSITNFGGVEMVSTEMLDDTINNNNQEVNNKFDNLENIVQLNKSELDEKINDTQSRIVKLETKHNDDIQGVQGQISQVKKDLLGSGELEDTLDTISEIGSWIKGHQAEYNSIVELQSKGVQGVQSQFTKITDDIKKDVTSLKETKATKIEVETIRNNLINLGDTVSTNKTDLEGKISGTQTRIGNLETKHTNEIKGVQGQINNVSNTLTTNTSNLQNNIDGVQTQINNLEIKYNNNFQGLQHQINNLNSDVQSSTIYDTESIGDDWTTEKVGGINKGMKKSDFTNKTISDMITDLIFPTLYPSIPSGKPSVTCNYTKELFVIGENIPTKENFTYTCDRGTWTYKKKNQTLYYAGDFSIKDNYPIISNSKNETVSFGEKILEDKYTITCVTHFEDGDTPCDNKGKDIDESVIKKYHSGDITTKKNIYGVYPIYITTNLSNISTPVEYTVNYFTGYTFSDQIITKETTDNKFSIYLPDYTNSLKITDFEIYQRNPTTGKFDIKTVFELKNSNNTKTMSNGFNYKIYVRTNNSDSVLNSDHYKITIKKK